MSPGHMRARAISMYLLVLQGGLAGGAALWGEIAERVGMARSLSYAAIGLGVGMLATFWFRLRSVEIHPNAWQWIRVLATDHSANSFEHALTFDNNALQIITVEAFLMNKQVAMGILLLALGPVGSCRPTRKRMQAKPDEKRTFAHGPRPFAARRGA